MTWDVVTREHQRELPPPEELHWTRLELIVVSNIKDICERTRQLWFSWFHTLEREVCNVRTTSCWKTKSRWRHICDVHTSIWTRAPLQERKHPREISLTFYGDHETILVPNLGHWCESNGWTPIHAVQSQLQQAQWTSLWRSLWIFGFPNTKHHDMICSHTLTPERTPPPEELHCTSLELIVVSNIKDFCGRTRQLWFLCFHTLEL